jgi:hypothetical protein
MHGLRRHRLRSHYRQQRLVTKGATKARLEVLEVGWELHWLRQQWRR